jgi:hypothetical protein
MLEFRNTLFTIICDGCGVILCRKSIGSSSALKESDIERPFQIYCEECLIHRNITHKVLVVEDQVQEPQEKLSKRQRKNLDKFTDSFYE